MSPEDAARLNEAQLSQRGLRLVTYNVWFSEYRQRIRAQALFGILSATKADIVCLQEVTPKFLSWLREEDFVRTNYALSDSVGTTLRGSELAYGVVLLVAAGNCIYPHFCCTSCPRRCPGHCCWPHFPSRHMSFAWPRRTWNP